MSDPKCGKCGKDYGLSDLQQNPRILCAHCDEVTEFTGEFRPRGCGFRVGDVVQLKSGGPPMTVIRHTPEVRPKPGEFGAFMCEIFEVDFFNADGILVHAGYAPACLKPYEPPPASMRGLQKCSKCGLFGCGCAAIIEHTVPTREDAPAGVLWPGETGPETGYDERAKMVSERLNELKRAGAVSPPSTLEKMSVQLSAVVDLPCARCGKHLKAEVSAVDVDGRPYCYDCFPLRFSYARVPVYWDSVGGMDRKTADNILAARQGVKITTDKWLGTKFIPEQRSEMNKSTDKMMAAMGWSEVVVNEDGERVYSQPKEADEPHKVLRD